MFEPSSTRSSTHEVGSSQSIITAPPRRSTWSQHQSLYPTFDSCALVSPSQPALLLETTAGGRETSATPFKPRGLRLGVAPGPPPAPPTEPLGVRGISSKIWCVSACRDWACGNRQRRETETLVAQLQRRQGQRSSFQNPHSDGTVKGFHVDRLGGGRSGIWHHVWLS